MKKLITGLLKLNCNANHKPEQDGKCRSKDCMMNVDFEVSRDISKRGCEIYKKLEEL